MQCRQKSSTKDRAAAQRVIATVERSSPDRSKARVPGCSIPDSHRSNGTATTAQEIKHQTAAHVAVVVDPSLVVDPTVMLVLTLVVLVPCEVVLVETKEQVAVVDIMEEAVAVPQVQVQVAVDEDM